MKSSFGGHSVGGELGRGIGRCRYGRGSTRGSSPIPSSGWLPTLPLSCPRSGTRAVLGPEEPRQGSWPLCPTAVGEPATVLRPASCRPRGQKPVPAPVEERAEGKGLHDDQQLNLPKTSWGQKGRASLKPVPEVEGTGEGRSWEEHMDSMHAGVTSRLKT